MKRNCMKAGLMAAMALGLAFGCNKTNLETSEPEDRIILSASPASSETRTTLGAPDNGVYQVLWKTGDRVSVNGVLSDNAVTSAQN